MFRGKMRWIGSKNRLIATVMGMLLLSLSGCASDTPKTGPTMSQDQVREHSDKAFERLKQEEKDRALGSGAAPY